MGEEEGGEKENILATNVDEVSEVEVDVEVDEEMVEMVMKWLEQEISYPSPSDDSYEESSSFVTINGNEESCGPSFSDSASTVMASFDTRGAADAPYFVGAGHNGRSAFPATASLCWPSAGVVVEESSVGVMEAEEESEDEWMARVHGGATFELEDSFLYGTRSEQTN